MKANTFAGVYLSTGWRDFVILFCACLECGALSRSGAYAPSDPLPRVLELAMRLWSLLQADTGGGVAVGRSVLLVVCTLVTL